MPILGVVSSGTFVAPASYESIASVVRSGGWDFYTFENIPATYEHLQLRVLARGTSSTTLTLFMQFNGDTGASYPNHGVSTQGSIEASGRSPSNRTYMSFSYSGSSFIGNTGTSIFGAGIIDIYDYAKTTKRKTVKALSGVETNDTGTPGTIAIDNFNWENTNAISSIKIYFDGANFDGNTTLALYGIKGK